MAWIDDKSDDVDIVNASDYNAHKDFTLEISSMTWQLSGSYKSHSDDTDIHFPSSSITPWLDGVYAPTGVSSTYFAANYIIYSSNGNYYAKNGITGDVDYTNSEAHIVLQSALQCSGLVVAVTDLTLNAGVTGSTYGTLDLGGHRVFASDSWPIGTTMFRMEQSFTLRNGFIDVRNSPDKFRDSTVILVDGEDGYTTWGRRCSVKDIYFMNDVTAGGMSGTAIQFYLDGDNGEAVSMIDVGGCSIWGFRYGIDLFNNCAGLGANSSYINGNLIHDTSILECKFPLTFRISGGAGAFSEINGNLCSDLMIQPNSNGKTEYLISCNGNANWIRAYTWDKYGYMEAYGKYAFCFNSGGRANQCYDNAIETTAVYTNTWNELRHTVKDNGYRFGTDSTNKVHDIQGGKFMRSLEVGSGNLSATIKRANETLLRVSRGIGSNSTTIEGGTLAGDDLILRCSQGNSYPTLALEGGSHTTLSLQPATQFKILAGGYEHLNLNTAASSMTLSRSGIDTPWLSSQSISSGIIIGGLHYPADYIIYSSSGYNVKNGTNGVIETTELLFKDAFNYAFLSGNSVYIRSGNYYLSGGICEITGDNKILLLQGNIDIIHDPLSGNYWVYNVGLTPHCAAIKIEGNNNQIVGLGGHINGNRQAVTGSTILHDISIFSGDHNRISNIIFDGSQWDTINLRNSNYNIIENNIIEAPINCFVYHSNNDTHNVILNNVMTRTVHGKNEGFVAVRYGGLYNVIKDNHIDFTSKSGSGYGIQIDQGSYSNLVEGNYILNGISGNGTGITLQNGDNISSNTFINNKIYNFKTRGYYIGDTCKILGGEVLYISGTGQGLRIYGGAEDVLVDGLTIGHCGGYGIELQKEHRAIITNCEIFNNSKFNPGSYAGIIYCHSTHWVSGLTIKNNTFYDDQISQTQTDAIANGAGNQNAVIIVDNYGHDPNETYHTWVSLSSQSISSATITFNTFAGTTDATALELEELTDGSETTLHSHGNGAGGSGSYYASDIIIYKDGNTYYAKDGRDQSIIASNTDASTLFNLSTFPNSRTYVMSGSYGISSTITTSEFSTLDLGESTLKAKDNINVIKVGRASNLLNGTIDVYDMKDTFTSSCIYLDMDDEHNTFYHTTVRGVTCQSQAGHSDGMASGTGLLIGTGNPTIGNLFECLFDNIHIKNFWYGVKVNAEGGNYANANTFNNINIHNCKYSIWISSTASTDRFEGNLFTNVVIQPWQTYPESEYGIYVKGQRTQIMNTFIFDLAAGASGIVFDGPWNTAIGCYPDPITISGYSSQIFTRGGLYAGNNASIQAFGNGSVFRMAPTEGWSLGLGSDYRFQLNGNAYVSGGITILQGGYGSAPLTIKNDLENFIKLNPSQDWASISIGSGSNSFTVFDGRANYSPAKVLRLYPYADSTAYIEVFNGTSVNPWIYLYGANSKRFGLRHNSALYQSEISSFGNIYLDPGSGTVEIDGGLQSNWLSSQSISSNIHKGITYYGKLFKHSGTNETGVNLQNINELALKVGGLRPFIMYGAPGIAPQVVYNPDNDTEFEFTIKDNLNNPLFYTSGGNGNAGRIGILKILPKYDVDINGSLYALSISSQSISGGTIIGKYAPSANGEYLYWSGANLLPKTNNTITLGSDANEFKNIWIDGIAYIDSLALHGDITLWGKIQNSGGDTDTYIDLLNNYISIQAGGNELIHVSSNGTWISSLSTPTYPSAATNKNYVDNNLFGEVSTISSLGSGQVPIYDGSQWINSNPPMTFNVNGIRISAQQYITVGRFTCPAGKKAYLWQAAACNSGGATQGGLVIGLYSGTTKVYTTSSSTLQYPEIATDGGDTIIRFMYTGTSITGYAYGNAFMNISVM